MLQPLLSRIVRDDLGWFRLCNGRMTVARSAQLPTGSAKITSGTNLWRFLLHLVSRPQMLKAACRSSSLLRQLPLFLLKTDAFQRSYFSSSCPEPEVRDLIREHKPSLLQCHNNIKKAAYIAATVNRPMHEAAVSYSRIKSLYLALAWFSIIR